MTDLENLELEVLQLKISVLEARINKDRAVKLQKYDSAGAYRDSQNENQLKLNQMQSDLLKRKESLELNSETVADLHQIEIILCLFENASSSFSKTIQEKIDSLSSFQNMSKDINSKNHADEIKILSEYLYFLIKEIKTAKTSL